MLRDLWTCIGYFEEVVAGKDLWFWWKEVADAPMVVFGLLVEMPLAEVCLKCGSSVMVRFAATKVDVLGTL